MQKISFLLISFFISFIISNCGSDISAPDSGEVRELTETEKMLANSSDKFGFNIFRQVNQLNKNENVFISPISISMALGMTLNGAAGTTYSAIQNTLELKNLTKDEINSSYQSLINLLIGIDPKVKFNAANSIWYRNSLHFKDDFINTNKKYFNATITALDFTNPGSVDIINNWVKDNTNGLINKILERISNYDIMYLINAIYFKGIWTYKFDKNDTRDDTFYSSDGSEASCKMMYRKNPIQYLEENNFKAVNLPYGNGAYNMFIFLPKDNYNVNSLADEFTSENFETWLSRFSEKEGELFFPRFKIEFKETLNDALKSLGMGIAFDSYHADFSEMYKGDAYISKVEHKTFINVDEEGTEAAAVTSVTIGVTSVGSNFYMKVNKPFIYLIRENNSGTILFIGKTNKV